MSIFACDLESVVLQQGNRLRVIAWNNHKNWPTKWQGQGGPSKQLCLGRIFHNPRADAFFLDNQKTTNAAIIIHQKKSALGVNLEQSLEKSPAVSAEDLFIGCSYQIQVLMRYELGFEWARKDWLAAATGSPLLQPRASAENW